MSRACSAWMSILSEGPTPLVTIAGFKDLSTKVEGTETLGAFRACVCAQLTWYEEANTGLDLAG